MSNLFYYLKNSNCSTIPRVIEFASGERLEILTDSCEQNDSLINNLFQWRKSAVEFGDIIPPTFDSTKQWFSNYYLANSNKLLFLVTFDSEPIGHIGFNLFFENFKILEIDNVIRGKKNCCKGIMSRSLRAMLDWSIAVLSPTIFFLRTDVTNKHAINFYINNNFSVDTLGMKNLYMELNSEDSDIYNKCIESDAKFVVLRQTSAMFTGYSK